jgi:hypothetical protein
MFILWMFQYVRLSWSCSCNVQILLQPDVTEYRQQEIHKTFFLHLNVGLPFVILQERNTSHQSTENFGSIINVYVASSSPVLRKDRSMKRLKPSTLIHSVDGRLG